MVLIKLVGIRSKRGRVRVLINRGKFFKGFFVIFFGVVSDFVK